MSKTFLTEEQYLEIERKAELKSEYFRGEMFAMSGASLTHARLVANIVFALGLQLRSSPCNVLSNDLRVRVGETGLYTYPDLVGFCGKPILLDGHQDTLLNPTLLVEVLSPSTEKYDRGRKFEHYQAIDSLKEYLLVSSERVRAELYTRRQTTDGSSRLPRLPKPRSICNPSAAAYPSLTYTRRSSCNRTSLPKCRRTSTHC
jgi:Uma2 family endonuclease